MKKAGILVCCAVIMSLAACSQQPQTSGTAFQPPIEGVQWGMSPEEVMDVLSLSEECIQNSDEWTAILQCDDMEIFGQDADALMVFDMKSQVGLVKMSIVFPDASEESLAERLVEAYGGHSGVNAGGKPYLWEDEKIEELPEGIQERFRYMWLECPPREEEIFSEETIWNAYKVQPLVTVALNDNVLTYDGGNMAAYLIYNDDTAYEHLQSLRSNN